MSGYVLVYLVQWLPFVIGTFLDMYALWDDVIIYFIESSMLNLSGFLNFIAYSQVQNHRQVKPLQAESRPAPAATQD